MFDFSNANDGQRKAIQTTEGPVLITAGPGTGKTYTLVQRAIYLIQEKGVKPEEILIATFTEKAAKELITRITNALDEKNIVANINEMYIGTFHSLCLRIIKENLEYTRLKKNYRTLDEFDQAYIVFQNIGRFRNLEGFGEVISEDQGAWRQANSICNLVNNLTEELVSADELSKDRNKAIAAVGRILSTYQGILSDNNFLDFSAIQTEAYWLLSNHPDVLSQIQDRIKYLMIDEYQDTNYIQEQLVFLLGDKSNNICVVGDDDQGLYRFRGATIRNILEFKDKFGDGECTVIPLVVNYRSNSDIVDFYNEWMTATDGARFRFRWRNYRLDKTIEAHSKTTLSSPAVVKLYGENDADEWHEKILNFINELSDSGKITDYNQIAFLFSSVKNSKVTALADYLENNGINVYSPRSDMFFEREEIMLMLGCLMLMFPQYVVGLDERKYKFLKNEQYVYYSKCIEKANQFLTSDGNADFRNWIRRKGKLHANLRENTDYAYSGLIYQMLEFELFASIIGTEMNVGLVDLRPARNIANFTQIIGKYEYLHQIDVLMPKEYKGEKQIDRDTEKLFNLYLRLLYEGGIGEYEDDSEYAPSGCVSFLTIHQSKGMEFPIVFVDSLNNVPRKTNDDLRDAIEQKYFKRTKFEPADDIKYFDFWRQYYTAFSRAQNLLVLTCNETNGKSRKTPSMYFRELYDELPSVEDEAFDIGEFEFEQVKDVNIKDSFSFTSHISVYQTCGLQYKFYKELGFAPVRASAMLFGTLVHQTIEDVHKSAINGEQDNITLENIESWFNANYSSLSKSERTYLAEPQKRAALNQVIRYVERQDGDWSKIKEAEVDVSLVKPDYIIEGKIDLIKGEGDTVEIVDFKSEKKPDMEKDRERIDYYRQQLQVYAHIVEERTGNKVSKMNLYYTGEEDGVPTISFPYKKSAINATIKEFDDTVHKILNKEFKACHNSSKVCRECDFRYYCGR